MDFKYDALTAQFDLFLQEKWTKQLEIAPKESIDVFSSVSLCTLDIVLQCAFSYSSDVQQTG
jgi:hypothetical protein